VVRKDVVATNGGILMANSERRNFASHLTPLRAQRLGGTLAKISALEVVK
jgi:hypothetical protein